MVVGVLGSVRAFALSRPPLVAFALCILGFAITTVSLAYYVRHNSNLPKPEADTDWRNFLQLLSSQELCVIPHGPSESVNTETVNPSSDNTHQSMGKVALSVAGNLSMSLLQHISPRDHVNGSFFSGYVTLKGWNRVCTPTDEQDESRGASLLMTVYIPSTGFPNTSLSHTLQTQLCVVVSGPTSLLPVVDVTADICAAHVLAAGTSVGHLISREDGRTLGEKQDDGWCDKGESVHIFYQNDGETPTILLTDEDRSLIHLHLIHTSYLLLGLALALVIYAALRGRHLRFQHVLLSDKDPLDA